MSEQQTTVSDPFELMRQAYDQALETWSTAMEKVVTSDEFASASGRFLKHYAEMQQSLRATSEATAESLHLPTTADVARVAQLVINVERKVDEVSDEAHALGERIASVPWDAVAALPARLDAIEARLDELAAAKPAPAKRASGGAKKTAARRSAASKTPASGSE